MPSRRGWPSDAGQKANVATNRKDMEALFSIIEDPAVREVLTTVADVQLKQGRLLKEVYLPLGRKMELVTCALNGSETEILESDNLMSPEHLATFTARFAGLPEGLRRTGIDGTLHRISRTINPITKDCTAVAARVGRVIQGHVEVLLSTIPQVLSGERSVLIIGPPNVGKTTVLRELSRLLSSEKNERGRRKRIVAVVDKSLEIAGSGNVPHTSIGPCRVLQVESPENQHVAMIEAVENQSPEVVVVDEISNRKQTEAARTISQRGVACIATVHGDGLASIVIDPERKELMGGIESGVLISDRAASVREDKRKAVQKRRGDPPFDIAIEVKGFNDWIIHEDIAAAVDAYLDGKPVAAWWQSKQIREEGGFEMVSTPVVAIANPGESTFKYALLAKGQHLPKHEDRSYLDFN